MTEEEYQASVAIGAVLAEHLIRPDGMCECGVLVNPPGVRGLQRAKLTTAHRAYVLAVAGFRQQRPPT